MMYSVRTTTSVWRHETSSAVLDSSTFSLPDLLFDDDSSSEHGSQTPSDVVDERRVVESSSLESVDILEVDQEREAPARPTSRLGFNRALSEPHEQPIKTAEREDRSEETYRWTCTLFASSSSPDVDAELEDEADDSSTFVDIPLADESDEEYEEPHDLDLDDLVLVDSRGFSVSEDDCQGHEETLDLFPPPPMKTPVVSLPKVVAPKPIVAPQPQPTSGRRMPFFVAPSPLSSRPTSPTTMFDGDDFEADFVCRPLHNPQRHLYTHRGLSRHALCQAKWFWNTRQDQWVENQNNLDHCEAYGGLVPSSPSSSKMGKKCSRPSLSTVGPKLTTHPRVGDVLSLRDSYFSQVDQCLWELPLWTMRKMLYMSDVQIGVERTRRMKAGKGREDSFRIGEGEDKGEAGEEDQDDDGDSIPDCMHMSTSSDLSDSSDSTLVESECDLSGTGPCVGSSLDAGNQIHLEGLAGCSSAAKLSSLLSYSPSFSSSVSTSSSLVPRHWESSWYGRWELLFELIQEGQHQSGVLDRIPKSPLDSCDFSEPSSSRSYSGATSGGVSLGVKSSFFHSGKATEQVGADDDDDEMDDDFWNDEDEDYGVLVPNPVFARAGILSGGER